MPLDIGVALELPPFGALEARKFAERTSQATDMSFVLDDSRTAHITLWQGRIPSSTIPRALHRSFEEFSRLNFDFLIWMSTTLVLRESGNVFWNVLNPTSLLSVHIEACARFHPYSKGLLMPHHERKLYDAKSSDELRNTISTYGFSCAGPLFEPHVTIGRVSDTVGAKTSVEEIVSGRYDFEPTSIVLGKLGEYGDIINVKDRIRV